MPVTGREKRAYVVFLPQVHFRVAGDLIRWAFDLAGGLAATALAGHGAGGEGKGPNLPGGVAWWRAWAAWRPTGAVWLARATLRTPFPEGRGGGGGEGETPFCRISPPKSDGGGIRAKTNSGRERSDPHTGGGSAAGMTGMDAGRASRPLPILAPTRGRAA